MQFDGAKLETVRDVGNMFFCMVLPEAL